MALGTITVGALRPGMILRGWPPSKAFSVDFCLQEMREDPMWVAEILATSGPKAEGFGWVPGGHTRLDSYRFYTWHWQVLADSPQVVWCYV